MLGRTGRKSLSLPPSPGWADERMSAIGGFGIPPEVVLPWSSGPYAWYRKIAGKKGSPSYYDVEFEKDENSKRFVKLAAIPINDIKLGPGVRSKNYLVTSKTDLPRPVEATFKKKWKGELNMTVLYPRLNEPLVRLKKIGSIDNEKMIVLGGHGMKAKAFFFRLPTAEEQYALMVHTRIDSFILYRSDEIDLRKHNKLPQEYLLDRNAGKPQLG